MGKEFLEPILSLFRMRKILPFLPQDAVVLDLGCGEEARLLRGIASRVKEGVGIDIAAKPWSEGNLCIMKGNLDGIQLPFPDLTFHCVIMNATLEHLEHRAEILGEIHRILKVGGTLLLTVPTWAAKPVLEFLAFRLHLVNTEAVAQHKTYFWKSDLMSLLAGIGFKNIHHRYFQFFFNNFVYAQK